LSTNRGGGGGDGSGGGGGGGGRLSVHLNSRSELY